MNHKQKNTKEGILLTIVMMAVSLIAVAESFESGGIYYQVTSDEKQICSVVNNGANSYSGSVIVPGSITYDGRLYQVTEIGDWAFDSCVNLTSLVLPEGILRIGHCAFLDCESLPKITLPVSVTAIGDAAFWGCSSLAEIGMSDNVRSLGLCAFNNCRSLASIEIPQGVTEIGYATFRGCISLGKVDLHNRIKDIGDYAFYGCEGLQEIPLYNGVTSIGDWAFTGCRSLLAITIPGTVEALGYSAFWGCSSLVSASLGRGLYEIRDWAFNGCNSLVSVTNMSDEPQEIGEDTFTRYGTLHVAIGNGDTYRSAEVWRNFEIIDDIEIEGLEEVFARTSLSVSYGNGYLVVRGLADDGTDVCVSDLSGRIMGQGKSVEGKAIIRARLPLGEPILVSAGNASMKIVF